MVPIAGAILSGLLALAAVWQQQNGFHSEATSAVALAVGLLSAGAGLCMLCFRERELKLAERELALKERELDDDQLGAKLQDMYAQVAQMDDTTTTHPRELASRLGVPVTTATALYNLMFLEQPNATN